MSPAVLAFTLGFVCLASVCLAAIGYLLVLLGAAANAQARSQAKGSSSTANAVNFAIIVPAHDEELVIGAMLSSLANLNYPAELLQVVVVADNCSDATAAIAREAGADVIERFNDVQRGKGFALADATHALLGRDKVADAFVIVDADTFVASNFLQIMEASLVQCTDINGLAALQGRYGVLNAAEGWRAALMAGAFDLFNHVKPLGRDALGFSVGLKGNGMVFSRALLEMAPFTGSSITEDIDYGLDLLLHHGVRVGYVPGATVKAQMPVTGSQAKSQRERWENGRFKLMRERVPSLLIAALQRGDIRLADAAVDLLLPPLGEIAGLLTLWTILTAWGIRAGFLRGAWFSALPISAIVGFVFYVFAGFKVAGAPREAYSALLKAPGYILWKFAVLASTPISKLRKSRVASSATDEWVRTERKAMPTTEGKSAP